jgi:hypothetical protein
MSKNNKRPNPKNKDLTPEKPYVTSLNSVLLPERLQPFGLAPSASDYVRFNKLIRIIGSYTRIKN